MTNLDRSEVATTRAPAGALPPLGIGAPIEARVTDVNIGFFSLMWLTVKAAFAAIPAASIIFAIWALLIEHLRRLRRRAAPLRSFAEAWHGTRPRAASADFTPALGT